ncbi:MAG: type IV pilus inner membrane component PilO [Planctomycetota bacterium]|jgi:Tfp pilus assembly protein PilO
MLLRKRQQIIICVVAIGIIGGFIFLKYLPFQRKIRAIELERAGIQHMVERARIESEKLPALNEEVTEWQGLVAKYELKIPVNRDLGSFLQEVADLMNQHELTRQQIQPSTEIEVDELKCIPVSMKCKGRLEQLFEFYKSLQNLDRLVRIEHVQLENEGDFNGEVSMETEAIVYYRPEKAKS